MKAFGKIAAGALVLSLGACAGGQPVARSTGTAPLGYAAIGEVPPGQAVLAPRYSVQGVRVEVPRDLSVSEANLFYPVADIVWRGEPRGDRYAQIHTIFLEAFGFGTTGMKQGPEVIVEARVRRFHALTEKTRYTVGGVHSIRFDLTVKDAATGAILDGPRFVIADVRATGGSRAVADEQSGRTQRVVIVEALSQTIRRELSQVVEGQPPATQSAPAAAVSQGPTQPVALAPLPVPETVARPRSFIPAEDQSPRPTTRSTEQALMWSVQSSL